MRERLDEALLKEMLGQPLHDRELAIVQWVRNGEGCTSCAVAASPGIRDESMHTSRVATRV